MKKVIPLLLFFIMLSGFSAQSQNLDRNLMLRQRVEQAKLRQIKLNLQMDELTFIRFAPIYIKYERSLTNLDFKSQNKILNVSADSLSVQDADELILAQWARAKQMIRIRERFYAEFREVLTAQQLVKLYQSETEIRKQVFTELVKRRR